MTKTKALKLMIDNPREVIDESLANKIAQAFGHSLLELKVKARRLEDFNRLTYSSVSTRHEFVAVYELAEGLIKSFDPTWEYYSPFEGQGRRTQDIAEKSVEEIKKHLI